MVSSKLIFHIYLFAIPHFPTDMNKPIKVFARVRPLNEDEIKRNETRAVETFNDGKRVCSGHYYVWMIRISQRILTRAHIQPTKNKNQL